MTKDFLDLIKEGQINLRLSKKDLNWKLDQFAPDILKFAFGREVIRFKFSKIREDDIEFQKTYLQKWDKDPVKQLSLKAIEIIEKIHNIYTNPKSYNQDSALELQNIIQDFEIKFKEFKDTSLKTSREIHKIYPLPKKTDSLTQDSDKENKGEYIEVTNYIGGIEEKTINKITSELQKIQESIEKTRMIDGIPPKLADMATAIGKDVEKGTYTSHNKADSLEKKHSQNQGIQHR